MLVQAPREAKAVVPSRPQKAVSTTDRRGSASKVNMAGIDSWNCCAVQEEVEEEDDDDDEDAAMAEAVVSFLAAVASL